MPHNTGRWCKREKAANVGERQGCSRGKLDRLLATSKRGRAIKLLRPLAQAPRVRL